jgi:hypothetical protein
MNLRSEAKFERILKEVAETMNDPILWILCRLCAFLEENKPPKRPFDDVKLLKPFTSVTSQLHH